MRFVGPWERSPQLGDVAYQASGPGAGDEAIVRRAYVVIGLEEGRDSEHVRLQMERVVYGTVPESRDPDAMWSFHNHPRRR